MPLATDDEALQVPGDAWEILRDCRAWFLKQAGQLLREAEPVSEAALAAFVKAVGVYFDEKTTSERRTSFDQLGDLTASNISLVGECDLELDIRLGSFSALLTESNGKELWRVYLRFVTLLGRPDLSPADNPVGPKAFAKGLTALCGVLDEAADRTLERIGRLEEHFSEFLPALYAGLNDFLIGRKVSAAQPTIVTAPDAATAASAGGAAGSIAIDPAVALQRSLLGQAQSGGGAVTMGAGVAASLLSQAMFGRLLARLDDLERLGPAGEGSAPRALDSTRLGVPAGAPEAAAIDALAMIFEAIFASPTLPDPIKTALSSLQIPTLRAVMLDRDFFTADAHPARQLLDKMARAAVGLPFDVSSRHPLCAIIQQIASRVRAEYVNDTQVLSRYVGELDKLIARRDNAAAQAAASYRPLIQRLEQGDQADLASRQAIDTFCLRTDVPPAISRFLRDHWQRLLRQVWLESGEESAGWQENKAVVDQLLWSVQPKVDIEERKRLARELPQMLQKISAGMQRVSVPEAARAEFLDACFALQTAAMRGAPHQEAEAMPPVTPAAARPVAGVAPALSELCSGVQRLRIYDLGGAVRGAGRYRQSAVRAGDWLSFRLADEEPICGRIGHVAKGSGKLLLANPDWDFAVLLHPAIAESQIKEGRASISSGVSLFNAAAEQALQQAPRQVGLNAS
ncbi:MAG TPA: DUF1631 family protein [Azonexus sp.]|nr:DUF1631 family protein [Azonexus sp.]